MPARIGRAAAALLCVAGVPLLVLALIHTFFGASISAYRPLTSDEIAYWHQAATFSEVGFRGGYYTADEITNPSGVTPFGPHGPGFAVVYGLFGALFGWSRHSVVTLNLVAIAVASSVWVAVTRPPPTRLLLAGVLLLTFWHAIFWLPTGMQESFHHAGAIILAGCFTVALGPTPKQPIIALGWIALGLLSFIRPSWVILLPLWAVASTHHARWPVTAGVVAGSLLYAGVVLFAFGSTVAPYGNSLFLRTASLEVPAQTLIRNLASNLQRIGRIDQYTEIELLHRFQYVALLLVSGASTVGALWRRHQTPRPTLHLPLVSAALAVALVAMLLLYQFASFAEHRILSAFLLFGAMLSLAAPGRLGPVIAAGLVISSAVSVRTAMTGFEAAWRDRFRWAEGELSETERAVRGAVAYRPDASRWCNTLLTSQYPPSLIAVPAGIGLSVVRNQDLLRVPPRSHYLLLDDAFLATSPAPLDVDPIATLPSGTLYVNRESGCD